MKLIKMKFSLLLPTFLLLKEANGFCSWPCFMQGKTFYNDRGQVDLIFNSAHQILIKLPDGKTINGECIQRNGRYILYRRLQDGDKDLYRCFKFNNVGDDGFSIIESPLVPLTHPPSNFCEFCSPEKVKSLPEVWVDKETTRIGCNVPKNCPVKSSADRLCTGCGKDRTDDGNNCVAKKGKKNKRYHKGY